MAPVDVYFEYRNITCVFTRIFTVINTKTGLDLLKTALLNRFFVTKTHFFSLCGKHIILSLTSFKYTSNFKQVLIITLLTVTDYW